MKSETEERCDICGNSATTANVERSVIRVHHWTFYKSQTKIDSGFSETEDELLSLCPACYDYLMRYLQIAVRRRTPKKKRAQR